MKNKNINLNIAYPGLYIYIGSTGIHAPPAVQYICLSGLFWSIFAGSSMTLNDFSR